MMKRGDRVVIRKGIWRYFEGRLTADQMGERVSVEPIGPYGAVLAQPYSLTSSSVRKIDD